MNSNCIARMNASFLKLLLRKIKVRVNRRKRPLQYCNYLQYFLFNVSMRIWNERNVPTCCAPKNKNACNNLLQAFIIYVVVWAGIEPATQGFSVLCSTD